LDQTYRTVAARLPSNPAVRFETVEGKKDLVLSSLDKLEEPPSLLALRDAVAARLPRVDLPEILLEIAARTGFTDAFTHLTERTARAADLNTSLCAVLLAEACNTGLEPLVHNDLLALRRDRLSWVNQNYIREETLLVGQRQTGFSPKPDRAGTRMGVAAKWPPPTARQQDFVREQPRHSAIEEYAGP
jgi:Tn3 transposase DDE domain